MKNYGGRVLLRDIAQATGFSINTVSHALNDKSDISEKTKKLIRQTADRMGYIGNASASFLRSGVSRVVAIIVGDISNPFYSILVKEIETSLRAMGYLSFVLNTDENTAIERQAIVAALQKNVDGILIAPAPAKEAENVLFLEGLRVPFVLVGRYFDNLNVSCVVSDDEAGSFEATNYLIAQGHRRILFFNGPLSVSSARQRFAGYRKALRKAGIAFDESLVAQLPITTEGGDEIISRTLRSSAGATAVLCYSDMIAWKVISTLSEMGLRVPEDISVIGFDDIQSRFHFPVPLTTVSISEERIAQKSVELLLEMLSSGEHKNTRATLPTRLIIRSTVRPIG